MPGLMLTETEEPRKENLENSGKSESMLPAENRV